MSPKNCATTISAVPALLSHPICSCAAIFLLVGKFSCKLGIRETQCMQNCIYLNHLHMHKDHPYDIFMLYLPVLNRYSTKTVEKCWQLLIPDCPLCATTSFQIFVIVGHKHKERVVSSFDLPHLL